MIAAIKVVIDKYLPVAVRYRTICCRKIVELGKSEGAAFHQSTEKAAATNPDLRIKVHKDKALPGVDLDRNQIHCP